MDITPQWAQQTKASPKLYGSCFICIRTGYVDNHIIHRLNSIPVLIIHPSDRAKSSNYMRLKEEIFDLYSPLILQICFIISIVVYYGIVLHVYSLIQKDTLFHLNENPFNCLN